MNNGRTKKIENLVAEVVIIGGGGAGLTAALTAIENGATDVIVLEKRSITGGNSSLASGLFATESHLQRMAMIYSSRDEIFKKTMDWNHYNRVNPRIIRAYINKSADTIRWLEEKGIEFEVGTRSRMHWESIPCYHTIKGKGSHGFAYAMKVLTQNCKHKSVQLLLHTSGKKILRESKGNITGVLANSGNEDFEIKARSAIIATGGFTGNKDLLEKYFPLHGEYRTHNLALPQTGDGVSLAADAGATIEEFATMIRETGHSFGKDILILFFVTREPYTVWVNKKGKRFIDECIGMHINTCANVINQQPERVAYTLYDDKIVQSVMEEGLIIGPPDPKRGGKFPDFRKILQAEAKHEVRVKISNTWDGIANWIGTDPKILKTTIEEYNTYCDRGYDETFVKERKYLVPLRNPPYYAIKFWNGMIDTAGPVRINERMEVLDKQDNPIPGLYAAGVIASGWQSYDACDDLNFGYELGFCINSGRIAGENVTRFVLSK